MTLYSALLIIVNLFLVLVTRRLYKATDTMSKATERYADATKNMSKATAIYAEVTKLQAYLNAKYTMAIARKDSFIMEGVGKPSELLIGKFEANGCEKLNELINNIAKADIDTEQ